MKSVVLSCALVSAIFTGSVYAAAANSVSDGTVNHHLRYECRQSGGMPRVMQLYLSGGPTGFVVSGSPRQMCLFHANGRLSVIATNTLESTYPSLAATAYRNAPLMTFHNGNGDQRWDITYCQHLGGTATIGEGIAGAYAHSATSNQFSMCMFPDGSAIDTWTLFYKRITNNPAVELTDKFKSPVLDIPASVLWGKAN